jgi:hypothetical protein
MNIIEDNKQKLELYRTKPPHASYISGLIDGDGTIFIRKIKDGYQSGISLTQSRTNILQILQYHYGGTIIKPSEHQINTNDMFNEYGYYDINNKRNSYNLIIRSNEYEYLLNDIYKTIILKVEQINYLKEFEQYVNKPDKIEEKENLFKLCSDKNETKLNEMYDISRLNIEYIQGLFDAEGHIFLSYKKTDDNKPKFTKAVYMKITQKNHPEILPKIQEFLGFGKVSDYNYYVDTFDDCLKLTVLLKDGLIIKYNQICAFEKYLHTELSKSEKYTDELHAKRESLYKIINKEKHQIEVYEESDYYITDKNNTNMNNNLKEGLLLKIENKNKICEEEKKIKQMEFYQKKSESMKGENHYFYNKHFTDDHKSKISMTNSKVKRGDKYTDPVLKEIFQLKGTMLQKDVAEKYDSTRETIRRIWAEEMLPTDHPNYGKLKVKPIDNEHGKTSAQKTSDTKKTLDNVVYLEIISWKKKKLNGEKLNGKIISSTKLAEHLSEKHNQKVTNDIVKNIWLGKTKLHEFNFPVDSEICFSEYLEIIGK